MAARSSTPGSSMRPILLILAGLLGVALIGVIVWSLWPRAPRDYCKELIIEPQYQVTSGFCHMKTKEIKFINDDGRTISLQARIADEPDEQRAGFQKIGETIVNQNQIFFLFPQEVRGPFHMCNMKTSLDIAWIRPDGSFVDVQTAEPGPEQTTEDCPKLYAPAGNGAYMYALEAMSGFFSKNTITKDKSRLVIESVK